MDVATDRTQSANDLMANRPNDYMVEEPTIVMPVYGIVHGVRQNAVFAEIESGEEYASILAYPAGVTTPYNWVSARFDYRQTYEQPIGREGSGITLSLIHIFLPSWIRLRSRLPIRGNIKI